MMETFDGKARVLVLGDSGVGKSSLVHRICHNSVLANPVWTVGCNVDVKLHALPEHRPHFVELWDVGGSAKHEKSRAMFYKPALHGIIFVHDVTNTKSSRNLWRWLEELRSSSGRTGALAGDADVHLHVPKIVVGTKLDLVPAKDIDSLRLPSIADELHCPAIALSTVTADGMTPHLPQLDRFFDLVLGHQSGVRTGKRPADSLSPASAATSSLLPALLARDTSRQDSELAWGAWGKSVLGRPTDV